MSKSVLFCIFFLSVCFTSLSSETLWDDANGDVYSRKIKFKINDSIKIIINEKSLLDYRSSVKSVKSYSIDIKSDDLVGVFELIPNGSVTENKTGQEKDDFKYSSEIQSQIIEVSDNFVRIRGVKSVSVNNKKSVVEITGDVAFKDIAGNRVNSFDIMNQNLKVTTVIDSSVFPVSDADMEESVSDLTGDVTNGTGKYKLTDEKKKELLLKYLNKVLNVIF